MIIRRRYICPPTTGEGPEEAPEGDESRHLGAGLARQQIPEANQSEPRPGCDCDEELEEGSLGVPVAYGCRDGGKPFLWVAKPFILDDLVVVERCAHDEGAEKGSCCTEGGNNQSAVASRTVQLDGFMKFRTYCTRQWCAGS